MTLFRRELARREVVTWLPRLPFLTPLLAPALSGAQPASSIPAGALIQPADLAKTLRAGSAAPLMLQVGFRVLYDRAHIAGSEYAGPAREPQGLKLLTDRVAALPRDTALVIYCGCCPWSHCPNIAAAYQALTGLSFTRVKVLHIEDNFGTDWAEKGYPTQQA
jgi:hypothetical protein